jgi:predicted ATP-grasp superfamily ATP-dependent carboligase
MNAAVLVTGGEEIAVLGAIRALRAAGHTTWVQASSARSYGSRSRASSETVQAPEPHADPAGFASAVIEACERFGLSAVLPGTEAALIALAPHRSRFPACTAVGVSEPATVERATSKQALSRIAGTVGLRMPPTVHVDLASLDNGRGGYLELPLVLKPLRSDARLEDGGLRHDSPRLIRSDAELRVALSRIGEGLAQPYMPGEIYGVCGVAWEGRTLCTMHQVGRRIWPRDCGMVSYAETVRRDPDLDARVRALVDALGWSGVFQLQLLVHEDELYAIDFNPRFYISISLAVAAGLNLPALWLAALLGHPSTASEYTTGIRWRSDPDDPRSILRGFRSGNRTRSLLAAVPRRRTTHAVFSWRDPAPLLTAVARLAGARGTVR